jgi:hypothetical protein
MKKRVLTATYEMRDNVIVKVVNGNVIDRNIWAGGEEEECILEFFAKPIGGIDYIPPSKL